MKKILLMLFAISAVGYSNPTDTTDTASVPVEIRAEVRGANSQLKIVDEDGGSVTLIEFDHLLARDETNNVLTGETMQTFEMFAESSLIGADDSNLFKVQVGDTLGQTGDELVEEEYNLVNGNGENLSATLSATGKPINASAANRKPYTITSEVASTLVPTGIYKGTKMITIIFDK